VSSTGAS